MYECAIHYTPRTTEEGKKINWKDGVRALYCIMHYGASTAPLPMQLILYLLIGAFSAVCNLLSFLLMRRIGVAFTHSVIASFVLSALLNYLLCIAFLFRHKVKWNAFGELAAYLLSAAVMGTLDWWLTGMLYSSGMTEGAAKAVAATAGFFGNFILRRFIVFPERRQGKKSS